MSDEGDTTESVMARIVAAAKAEMGLIVDEATDDVKERCSKPVGYQRSKVIRSKPGESPRKETGGYVAGMYGKVQTEPASVTGIVGNDFPLAEWLSQGTRTMAPRPHFPQTEQKFAPKIEDRIASAINSAP